MSSSTRHLIRRLLKSPGFAAVTLLTLAIGIGANTAIFSVMNGILFKPLPYPDSDRLIGLWLSADALKIPELNASPSIYFVYREESTTMDHVGLWQGDSVVIHDVQEPERVDAVDVTPSIFSAFETVPAAGRLFTEQDAAVGAPKTVILTYGYLQKRFGGDAAAALGKRIRVDGEAREIIGVLPKDFRFLDENPQMILPLIFDRSKVFVGNFSYRGIARLKPGVTLQQASTDVTRMIPIMMRKFPAPPGFSLKMLEDAGMKANLRPLKQDVIGNISTLLWVLMGTIGIVLFIACANVANLLLVRAEGRQHELAIRAALGASRGEVARELLTESVLLGLSGGVLGLGFAYGLVRLLVSIAPAGLPRLEEITMDPIVFAFALGISLIAGVLFGLIPVFKYAGPVTAVSLREGGGRNASEGRERHRARSTLVVAQVALALVLLVGAGLMLRTFQAMSKVDPGFKNPAQVLLVSIAIPEAQVPSVDRVVTMYQEMLRKVGEIPGVQSASIAASITMDGNQSNDPVFAEDRTYRDGELPPIRRYKHPAPGHFANIGNPVVAGRDFTWDDIKHRSPYVILSENLARELWGDPNRAIGKRIRERPQGAWREIIGVVGDERDDGTSKPAPKTVHWPLVVNNRWGQAEEVRRWVTLAVRSPRTGTEKFLSDVRAAIWSVDSSVPISNVRTLEQLQKRSMARTSFTMVMLGIASAMALLLGIVGIYGVISYSVSQRTREIGIRTALGASNGSVQGMFIRHALLLAGIGVVVGLGASFAVTRWMASLLYDVSPVDGVTFTLVPCILVAAAVTASYLPARRATRVDPMAALRTE